MWNLNALKTLGWILKTQTCSLNIRTDLLSQRVGGVGG